MGSGRLWSRSSNKSCSCEGQAPRALQEERLLPRISSSLPQLSTQRKPPVSLPHVAPTCSCCSRDALLTATHRSGLLLRTAPAAATQLSSTKQGGQRSQATAATLSPGSWVSVLNSHCLKLAGNKAPRLALKQGRGKLFHFLQRCKIQRNLPLQQTMHEAPGSIFK